jgi:hypothetical protein
MKNTQHCDRAFTCGERGTVIELFVGRFEGFGGVIERGK